MSVFTWEEAAREAAAEVDLDMVDVSVVETGYNPLLDTELLIEDVHGEDADTGELARQRFFGMIENGLVGFIRECGDITEARAVDALSHVVGTIIAKQHDYGHENILWGGVDALVVRIHDKVARIKNLQKRADSGPINESLCDSWLDIAGYGIIAVMLHNGTFELPLSTDIAGPGFDFLEAFSAGLASNVQSIDSAQTTQNDFICDDCRADLGLPSNADVAELEAIPTLDDDEPTALFDDDVAGNFVILGDEHGFAIVEVPTETFNALLNGEIQL